MFLGSVLICDVVEAQDATSITQVNKILIFKIISSEKIAPKYSAESRAAG